MIINNRIAILYICTGKYDIFWAEFYNSCEANFCLSNERHYFVFTDSPQIKSQRNITKVYQDSLGWPFNTLFRYRMFERIHDQLAQYDYVVFFNSNCQFVEKISLSEFFGNKNKQLVACKHPGFFDKKSIDYTYESRKKSRAYVISPHYYFAGGINGGKSEHYLTVMRILLNSIETDLDNGIVALWHDESHWNAYLNNNFIDIKDSLHILDSSFLYPEDWELPFSPKIIVRDKSRVLLVDQIKDSGNKIIAKSLIRRILNKLRKYTKILHSI